MSSMTTVSSHRARRFGLPWAFAAAATVMLAVVACSSDGAATPTPGEAPTEPVTSEASPTATAADEATPAGEPTPEGDPTSTPTPHVTPPPTLAPVPVRGLVEVSPGSTVQAPARVFAGLDVEFALSGFSPLEEFSVLYLGPNGERRSAGRGRADMLGEATWTKPTSRDAMGEWTAQVLGTTGSQATAEWTLAEMAMNAPVVDSLESQFKLYHIPEARIYFDDGVFKSQVAVMARYFAESIGPIESALGQDLDAIDIFLLPNGEAVQREMVAAGSSRSSGFESGIALLGGTRPGIYIDMAAPFYSWRHIAAHEIVHFVIGAIEQDRRAPLWVVEGIADYLAYQVAVDYTGDHERQWARLVRGHAHRAIHLDRWIDFRTLGDYEAWNSERSLDRLKQMYGQSFAAAQYIVAAYGEAAFVPLLRAVIEEPEDLDVPFRRILGVSIDEFQEAVRNFLLKPTPFEVEMEAAGEYARAVFAIMDDDRRMAAEWDEFLGARRPSLDPEASAAEILEFSAAFTALAERVEALEPPDRLADVHGVLEAAFPLYVEAMNAYARLETRPETDLLAEANANLSQAVLHVDAAEQLLVRALTTFGISEDEIFPPGPA